MEHHHHHQQHQQQEHHHHVSSPSSSPSTCPPFTIENLTAALLCISEPLSSPSSSNNTHFFAASSSSSSSSTFNDRIKQAESALLSWEKENPNVYTHNLLSLILSLEETISSTCRLAALLSLMACVKRTWKDRGRGGRRVVGVGGGTSGRNMLSSEIKEYVRKCVLSIVTNGGADVVLGEGDVMLMEKKWKLIRFILEEKQLQLSASSLLSKIGRLDLPLSFHSLIPILVQYTTIRTLPDTFILLPKDVNTTTTEEEIKEQIIMTIRCNASDALEMVLAELCSKRLLVDKKYIASISRESVGVLVNEGWMMAMSCIGSYITSAAAATTTINNDGKILSIVTYTNFLSKILSHLFLSAFPSLTAATGDNGGSASSSAIVDQVYSTILEAVPALLRFLAGKTSSGSNDNAGKTVQNQEEEKIVHELDTLLDALGLLVVEVQKAHPMACSRFVRSFLDMFYSNLMEIVSASSITATTSQATTTTAAAAAATLTTTKSAPQCFLMCAMKFLANVASCSHYMPNEGENEAILAMRSETVSSSGDRRAITSKGDATTDMGTVQGIVQTVWFDFFTADRLRQLADVAIRHFMILSSERLEEWEADPESFAITESQRDVDGDLAECAQNLFLSLVESDTGLPIIGPLVVNMLGDVESQLNAARCEAGQVVANDGNANVLLWNAIYTAAGLSVNPLTRCEGFSMDAWFEKCLIPCLASILQGENKTNALPILRYRLLWLIGCCGHCISDTKTALEVLVSTVNDDSCTENDVAVRLAAVDALTAILNINYDLIDVFYIHLERLISSLYRLVNDCAEISSRAETLSCISLLLIHVVASGRKIDDATANATVGPLPSLWDASIEQNILLRRDVLSIISAVGTAVDRAQVGHLYPVALPMINSTLDPSCRDRDVCLVEDVLRLWLVLLRLATSYESHWEKLFCRVKDVLQQDLEHIKILMLITEGYILLGGASFLNVHSSMLQVVLLLVVGKTKPRGAAYIGLVLEALLRKFPVEGGTLLLQGGIMKLMLSSCAANYQNDSSCEPDRVVVLYLTAIARSLLGNPNLLDGTFPVTSLGPEGVALSFGAQELIDMNMIKFKGIEPDSNGVLHQKLWLLFMLSLLPPTPAPTIYSSHVLERMDQLLDICLTMLTQQGALSNADPYTVGYDCDEETVETGKKAYEGSIIVEMKQDIVNTSNVQSIFKMKMEGLAAAVGNDTYQQVLSTVEPVILQQLERIVNT